MWWSLKTNIDCEDTTPTGIEFIWDALREKQLLTRKQFRPKLSYSKGSQQLTMLNKLIRAPMINLVFLGCTRREAKVNTRAVQSKTELLNRLATNCENGEMGLAKKTETPGLITAWSYDLKSSLPKLALKCIAGCQGNTYFFFSLSLQRVE